MTIPNARSAHVVPLTADRIGAAADALVASHAHYPAFRAVFPDDRRRRRALRPFLAATIRDALPFGAVYAALGDDRVIGVAVWLPPGAFPWSWRRKMRAVPAFARVFAADPRRFAAFTRYGANAERTHAPDASWYLVVLGVRPDGQHAGAGSRLMATMLERIDRDRSACHLETSDPANIAFYERYGFVVTDPALLLVPGGPPHVRMRRPPQ